jgi:hypothetical protein
MLRLAVGKIGRGAGIGAGAGMAAGGGGIGAPASAEGAGGGGGTKPAGLASLSFGACGEELSPSAGGGGGGGGSSLLIGESESNPAKQVSQSVCGSLLGSGAAVVLPEQVGELFRVGVGDGTPFPP